MTRTEIEHILSGLRGKLMNIARRFKKVSGTAVDTEDIVQEALTELWLLLESGYQIRNVEAVAVKITKTVCVRHYRKQKIQTTAIGREDFSGGTAASERVDMQETLDTRDYLWSKLSATQKRYLQLRDEEAMTLDQIAEATGRPKSSIKSTISQARKTMADLLTNFKG